MNYCRTLGSLIHHCRAAARTCIAEQNNCIKNRNGTNAGNCGNCHFGGGTPLRPRLILIISCSSPKIANADRIIAVSLNPSHSGRRVLIANDGDLIKADEVQMGLFNFVRATPRPLLCDSFCFALVYIKRTCCLQFLPKASSDTDMFEYLYFCDKIEVMIF